MHEDVVSVRLTVVPTHVLQLHCSENYKLSLKLSLGNIFIYFNWLLKIV